MNSEASYANFFDFKEISKANTGTGEQDHFELFARELLEAKGFYIERTVTRGADGRKDLIVSEIINGVTGQFKIRSLVSCKHNAHSNRSANESLKDAFLTVLQQYDCSVFIGFYSTVVSSGVEEELERLKANPKTCLQDYLIADKSLISAWLLENNETLRVFRKHMPKSYSSYFSYDVHSEIYREVPIVFCDICDVNILNNFEGYYNEVREFGFQPSSDKYEFNEIRDIYFTCRTHKGQSSKSYERKYSGSYLEVKEVDIASFLSPLIYLERMMSQVAHFRFGVIQLEDDVFRKWNRFYRAMFYFVSRKAVRPRKKHLFDALTNYKLK